MARRWDNDEVEKLSPWDLEPLEDCSTLKLIFLIFIRLQHYIMLSRLELDGPLVLVDGNN